MNEELQQFARKRIKEGLRQLPERCVLLFNRMYSHENIEASIDEAVDNMSEDKLELAMNQIACTLDKDLK